MKTPIYVIVFIVAMGLLLLYCVFKIYTVGKFLDSLIIVLIEQTWTLQLLMLRSHGGKEIALAWKNDALVLPGPKGELIIRRFELIKQWALSYNGVVTNMQREIEKRIEEIDVELLAYRVNLRPITALTERMLIDMYNLNYNSASNITANIISKLAFV